MEVKIGVQHASRELVLDSDLSGEEIESAVVEAMAKGLLTLTDTKGRRVIVPADRVAYVELGSPSVGQVGFRS